MDRIWHRWEERDVRPFYKVESAANAVANACLRPFDGKAAVITDTSFDLDELDLPNFRPVVIPNIKPVSEWLPRDCRPDELSLVVVVANSILKDASVVHRERLDSPIPPEIAIPRDDVDRLGGGRNLTVSVAICLDKTHRALPGLPFLEGHWLSKKTFTARDPTAPDFFDIRPRTDEEWAAVGYPSKTLFSVDYNGAINEEPDPGGGQSVATVWIHKDAYDRITADGRQVGRILQPVLGVEIIAQILELSAHEWRDADQPIPGSPLATVLRRLSAGRPLPISELKTLVEGAGRARLRALLQDCLQLVRAVVESWAA